MKNALSCYHYVVRNRGRASQDNELYDILYYYYAFTESNACTFVLPRVSVLLLLLYCYYICIYTARTILYCIILAYFRRSASAPSHIHM